MSFDDFAAQLKTKQQQKQGSTASDKTYNFAESYRIRAKMLGVLLRDARESAARTVEDCARLLHISIDQYQGWEDGDDVPALPELELLAYYLDVPISHFWGLETSKITRAGRENIQSEYLSLRNRMVGALLYQARTEANISHEELAQASGIDAEQIEHYELGDDAIPMHQLAVLANAVNKNMSYFLETSGHIGELLAMREAWKHFATLPKDVREFVADPRNIGFIHIAVLLSQMPVDRLREVGASILDITM
jgi:transcriptional regulator with XRE-family HTH domain